LFYYRVDFMAEAMPMKRRIANRTLGGLAWIAQLCGLVTHFSLLCESSRILLRHQAP
jgi:hypothetical protein